MPLKAQFWIGTCTGGLDAYVMLDIVALHAKRVG